MQFKVIANNVEMNTGSAQRALNTICSILQGHVNDKLYVKVMYQTKAGEWKIENSFRIGEPAK